MQDDKCFDIGDEVYVFYQGYSNWLKALRENTFVKGVVVDVDNEDFGYHGSGDWVHIYTVKGEDGREYLCDYKRGYKSYVLYTKEDILNSLKRNIEGEISYKKRVYQEANKKIKKYQELLEKYQDLDELKGSQYIKKRGK